MPAFIAPIVGAFLDSAVGEIVATIAISFAINKLTEALASRPPNVIPHSEELTGRFELIARAHETELSGVRCEIWEGAGEMLQENMLILQTLGGCLEPEVPDRRSFIIFERSLPPRSGDLVAFCDAWNRDGSERRTYSKYIERVASNHPHPPIRGSRYWHTRAEEWVCHCNEGPFKFPSGARMLGRRVAQITLPEGFPMDDRARVCETLQIVAEHYQVFGQRMLASSNSGPATSLQDALAQTL